MLGETVVVFYQNDKSGKFTTHKDGYRPSNDELIQLINTIDNDTGMIGFWCDSAIHYFTFSHDCIYYESDTRKQIPLISKTKVDVQYIINLYDANFA